MTLLQLDEMENADPVFLPPPTLSPPFSVSNSANEDPDDSISKYSSSLGSKFDPILSDGLDIAQISISGVKLMSPCLDSAFASAFSLTPGDVYNKADDTLLNEKDRTMREFGARFA